MRIAMERAGLAVRGAAFAAAARRLPRPRHLKGRQAFGALYVFKRD
jgi:hypothetical protein